MPTGAAILLGACAAAPIKPAGFAFDGAALGAIDSAIGAAVERRGMPGAQFHLEKDGAVFERAYGALGYEAGAPAVTLSTVFDVASLTKVLATAPSVLLLVEQGKLDLEAPLYRYVPACGGRGRDGLTLRHLLTHSSGFPAGLPARPAWQGRAAALALACGKDITDAPGTAFRYSDINYVLLGIVVEQTAGMALDQFAARHIFAPLAMRHTGFLPLQRMAAQAIAPTHLAAPAAADQTLHPDLAHGEILQGVVHDPTARRMGGVAGSAGLFSTAPDLARYARMLLNEGELDGVRVLSPASARLLGTVQSPPGLTLRAIGMDIDSPFARPRGTLFPVGSYGHTGYTGCFLWIDPASRTLYTLLSNRVYPDDKSNILPLYGELGTLAAQAAGVAPPQALTTSR
ncbi:MAG: hypothetical protein JWP59_2983 [Massilia sp.]|nr:hypothetical protein [Massilia sp.]